MNKNEATGGRTSKATKKGVWSTEEVSGNLKPKCFSFLSFHFKIESKISCLERFFPLLQVPTKENTVLYFVRCFFDEIPLSLLKKEKQTFVF